MKTHLAKHHIRCSDNPTDLFANSRDLWPKTTLELSKGQLPSKPELVVWPQNKDQLKKVVSLCVKQQRIMMPYGAGSGVCGALTGREDSVVIDTKCMNRVLSIDADTKTACIESGALGQRVEDRLNRAGWTMGHSPSSIMCSTIGGYLAARSAGQFSSKYGVFDDMVAGATAICPSGEMQMGSHDPFDNPRNLAVFSGSEGGLGIASSITINIHRLAEKRWFSAYAFPNVESAWSAAKLILQSNLYPLALRIYDPIDSKLSSKESGNNFIKSLAGQLLKNPSLRSLLLRLPLSTPRLVNAIANRLNPRCLMILGFEGSRDKVAHDVSIATTHLKDAENLGESKGMIWYQNRHKVSYKLAPLFMAGGFADTMEVAAPWSQLKVLNRNVRKAIGEKALVMAHYSHAYREGCSIYFSFASKGSLKRYESLWANALDAAINSGGVVTHHHGVGQLKSEAATKQMGHALRLWWDVKDKWDPNDLMNPNRPFQRTTPQPQNRQLQRVDSTIISVSKEDRLARVHPKAAPKAITTGLAHHGLELKHPINTPPLEWILSQKRRELSGISPLLFGVQGRFKDGAVATICTTPRTAVGPDLRWELLEKTAVDWVELPVELLDSQS